MSVIDNQVEAIKFQLKHIAKIANIQNSELFGHVDDESIEMMLEQAARFAEAELVELAEKGDIEGCKLENGKVTLPANSVEVYKKYCDLGFPPLSLPLDVDGFGFPKVVQAAVQEVFDGANMALGMLCINTRCSALVLMDSAPQALQDRWLAGMVSGEIGSTISISEPQAGSDVGRIRVNAKPTNDDKWLINGSKIWISFGDHDATDQIVHIVLARMPESAVGPDAIGTRGLGLFAVPKYRDDVIDDQHNNGVSVSRIEHKMGLMASPTCVLELNNAEGYLLGKPGAGLPAMFVMMNSMRLAVATQTVAVSNAATHRAIEYAKERPQGGRPDQAPVMITEHADVRRMLLEMIASAELCRSLQLITATYLDMAAVSSGNKAKSSEYQLLAELLLPVAKTVCAELAFENTSKGVQVMGGFGYTNDYPMERMLRDVRVSSVFEGTSGIQSLDFINRKVRKDGGEVLRGLFSIMQESIDSAKSDNVMLDVFKQVLSITTSSTDTILSTKEQAGAYGYLRLMGHCAMCWGGLTLLDACEESSPHQQQLKAAITLFSKSAIAEASKWSESALLEESSVAYSFT